MMLSPRAVLSLKYADVSTVWWFGGGSHFARQNAVCAQGVLDPVREPRHLNIKEKPLTLAVLFKSYPPWLLALFPTLANRTRIGYKRISG